MALHPPRPRRLASLLLLAVASVGGADPVGDLLELGRSAALVEVGRTPLHFRTFEVAGLERVGGAWYLASREPGADGGPGRAHLFVANDEGRVVDRRDLGAGAATTPGGLVHADGELWVTVREEGGRTLVQSVRLDSMFVRTRFVWAEPLRALHVDAAARVVRAWTVDGRDRLDLSYEGRLLARVPNRNHVFPYAEVARLPGGALLAAGAARRELPAGVGRREVTVAGLAALSPGTLGLEMVHPFAAVSPRFRPMLGGGMTTEVVGDELRLHVAPDPVRTIIYTFAPRRGTGLVSGRSRTPTGRQ